MNSKKPECAGHSSPPSVPPPKNPRSSGKDKERCPACSRLLFCCELSSADRETGPHSVAWLDRAFGRDLSRDSGSVAFGPWLGFEIIVPGTLAAGHRGHHRLPARSIRRFPRKAEGAAATSDFDGVCRGIARGRRFRGQI